MPLFCQAKANCGVYALEGSAHNCARGLSRNSPDPFAVYNRAGQFDVYQAPVRIEGFGHCVAVWRNGERESI